MNVLFLCTGNSARSILCAATLNHLGSPRFRAYSAGSQPAGRVHPEALAELARRGIEARDARSKSWDEYTGPDGPAFDLVITVCDSAAAESCPVLFGDFAKAHWGLPDPAAVAGDPATIREAFSRTQHVIEKRLAALVALPPDNLTPPALPQALAAIAERVPAVALVGALQ